MRRILIGLGSGRCGTTSLAALLDAQPDTRVTHTAARLRYEMPSTRQGSRDAAVFVRRMLTGTKGVVGDVAQYWLPYVPGFRHGNARFVCMQRDKRATIEDYLSKADDPADEGLGRRLGIYIDTYYRHARRLADSRNDFRIYDIETLNTQDGVERILSFCGYEPKTWVAEVGLRMRESDFCTAADNVLGMLEDDG